MSVGEGIYRGRIKRLEAEVERLRAVLAEAASWYDTAESFTDEATIGYWAKSVLEGMASEDKANE